MPSTVCLVVGARLSVSSTAIRTTSDQRRWPHDYLFGQQQVYRTNWSVHADLCPRITIPLLRFARKTVTVFFEARFCFGALPATVCTCHRS